MAQYNNFYNPKNQILNNNNNNNGKMFYTAILYSLLKYRLIAGFILFIVPKTPYLSLSLSCRVKLRFCWIVQYCVVAVYKTTWMRTSTDQYMIGASCTDLLTQVSIWVSCNFENTVLKSQLSVLVKSENKIMLLWIKLLLFQVQITKGIDRVISISLTRKKEFA